MLSNLYKLFILRFLFIFVIGVNFIPVKVYCNQEIVLFGDSLMSGYGLDEDSHLSTVLEKSLKLKEFDGFNVTIPYKEKIINFLDSLDENAKKIV